MRENFDFSTINDQNKFLKLPQEGKDIIVAKSYQEAKELRRRVQSGEAKNYSEAEQQLEKEILEISENPELILSNFLKNPLPDSPNWESSCRSRVRERLNNTPAFGYTQALRKYIGSLNLEKEKIISALFSMDLKNFKDIPNLQGYNKTTMLRIFLNAREKGAILQGAIDHHLNKLSLEEIKLSTKYLSDQGLVAKLALERLHSEPKAAQEILDKVQRAIERLNLFDKYSGINNFPAEVLEFAFKKLLDENPHRFDAGFENIINLNERKKNSDDKDYKLKNEIDGKSFFNEIPVLKEAFNLYSKQKEISLQEEAKRQEADNTKKEAETKQLEEDQKAQAEREWIEKEKAETEEANQEVDDKIEILDTCEFTNQISTKDVIKWDERRNELSFISSEMWPIIKSQKGFLSYNSICQYASRFYKADSKRKQQLSEKVREILDQWEEKKNNVTFPSAQELFIKIVSQAALEKEIAESQQFKTRLNIVENILRTLDKEIKTEMLYNPKGKITEVLEELKQLLLKTEENTKNKHDATLAKEHEMYRTESLENLKKDYLLQQVEAQIDYLKELYSQMSGLELGRANGVAGDYYGNNIGSVTSGLTLKMEQRLELRLELKKGEEIKLEMGETMEGTHFLRHILHVPIDIADRIIRAAFLI